MKKNLLIMAMCLIAPLSANAATWVALDSGSPEIQLFMDTDSIKCLNADTCTYALLYKKRNDDTKAIYIKSDYSKDRAGVIRTEDYRADKYSPGFYSQHSRAFMKPVDSSAVLRVAHNYALSQYTDKAKQLASSEIKITNITDVKSLNATNYKLGLSDNEFENYVQGIKDTVKANWKTSINTINTDINLLISINVDGSLNGYRIMESSDSDNARRAAVAAVNLSAPFQPFPDGGLINRTTITIPIKFEQKFVRKYVK